MKKIISALLAMVMLFSTIPASAVGLDFLTDGSLHKMVAESTMQMELDMDMGLFAEWLASVFEDADTQYGVDLAALLGSISDAEQKTKFAINISEDFKKTELAITSQVAADLKVNFNLGLAMCATSGIWVKLDLSDLQKPIFEIVYTTPKLNKYVTVDVLAQIEAKRGASAVAKFISLADVILDTDTLVPLMKRNRALVEKYATVTKDTRLCSVHFENDGFSRYIGDLLCELVDVAAMYDLILPTAADANKMIILTAAAKTCLLGEDGYTVTYSLTPKKTVQKMTINADFDVHLQEIMTVILPLEKEWKFKHEGHFVARVHEEIKVLLSGASAYVTYPELTAENTVTYAQITEDAAKEVVEENIEVGYPPQCVRVETDAVPQINGTYYVPLRAVLDAAYGKTEYTIDFAPDGTLTISSPHFKTIEINIGSSYALVGDKRLRVDEVILYNETTTYVSRRFFSEVFDWQMLSVNHDLEYEIYRVDFYTR